MPGPFRILAKTTPRSIARSRRTCQQKVLVKAFLAKRFPPLQGGSKP